MKIWLSRWITGHPKDNLERLPFELERASSAGAEMIVLPELFLTGYSGIMDPEEARICFSGLSGSRPERLILFGTISEEKRNRATMWLGGKEILRYDKVNLFLPNGEDKLWERGERYCAAETPFGRVGVAVCNDIRFPEAARALRMEQRVELLLVPAWWPWRRNDTWRTLLKARAIENAIHVAGCCVSSADADSEKFSGAGNYLFDPLGKEVPTGDDSLYEIDVPFRGTILVDPLETPSAGRRTRLFES